jgi:hypothetical protein
MKISGSISSLSNTIFYFPSDHLHLVYVTIPCDQETKRRLETVGVTEVSIDIVARERGRRLDRRVSV